MVNAADFAPSPRPVTGAARLTRGLLAASLAIGSAAVSHSIAGHHPPHWIVIVLAFAVSLPVCASLSGVRLSRVRLGVAVVFSQAVLHGLFAFFPAASASASATMPSDVASSEAAAQVGHAAHDHAVVVAAAAQTSAVTQVLPDGPMLVAHALAALFSFAVFRRGEMILHALSALLLRPIFLLFLRPVSLTGPRAIRAHDSFSTVILQDLWLGGGARTLRGPPVLVS